MEQCKVLPKSVKSSRCSKILTQMDQNACFLQAQINQVAHLQISAAPLKGRFLPF